MGRRKYEMGMLKKGKKKEDINGYPLEIFMRL